MIYIENLLNEIAKHTIFYERNKKRAECIVELYKHLGTLKNTRDVLEA